MQPDALFRLLTSVEGYKIMDPHTDNFGQGVVKVGRPVPYCTQWPVRTLGHLHIAHFHTCLRLGASRLYLNLQGSPCPGATACSL